MLRINIPCCTQFWGVCFAVSAIQCFKVFPSEPILGFQLVGSLSFEKKCVPVCFVGDLFVVLSDDTVTVWNPIQDYWARWQIGIIGESVRTVLWSCCMFSELKYRSSLPIYNALNVMTTFSSWTTINSQSGRSHHLLTARSTLIPHSCSWRL